MTADTEPAPPANPNTLSELEFRPIHISGYDRQMHDFYPTPDWVTGALLKHVKLRNHVWEPCRGGVDFFACTAFPAGCHAMVTNPPYGDGGELVRANNASLNFQRFVRHAL